MSANPIAAAATTIITAAVTVAAAAVVAVSTPGTAAAAPTVGVTRVVGGLEYPWDLTWVGGTMLFTERDGRLWSKRGSGDARRVSIPLPRIYDRVEGGLLGIVADPAASSNKTFYTCLAAATSSGGPRGVEVWKWRLTSDTRAVAVRRLISGIPLTSGIHTGCRLRFRSARALYVATGDSAVGTAPQSLRSLGGKVLRVRSDGSIPRSNPFYSRGGNARYVWTYGHRNIQGLAKRPGRSEMWSVEHGTDRDDEINLVLGGRNYGWDPGPSYDQSRPMTDKSRYPNAVSAKWRSGHPTIATSGAGFLSGSRWGSWNGRLAVALLKGQGIALYSVSSSNAVRKERTAFTGYGRIRTVQQGPDGNLYFTTSNGSNDAIYKITPR